jgi:hypothetical protein
MEENEKAQILEADRARYRTSQRHPVHSGALLSVLGQDEDLSVQCKVLDLSLGGCRLHARDQFAAEAQVRVEVTFTIRGLPLLLPGVIQWTDREDQFGIRFLEMSDRRKELLMEVLAEVAAFHVAEPAKAASEGAAKRKTEIDILVQPPSQPADARLAADARDRRAYPRQNLFSTAVIYLIDVGGQVRGQLLDLSLNGCRIRADEPSNISVHTRVNAELLLDGVLFRLPGVIAANEDQSILRVQFQGISDRLRDQLKQFIGQIKDI